MVPGKSIIVRSIISGPLIEILMGVSLIVVLSMDVLGSSICSALIGGGCWLRLLPLSSILLFVPSIFTPLLSSWN